MLPSWGPIEPGSRASDSDPVRQYRFVEASANVRTPKNRRNNNAIRIATIPGRQADEIGSICSGNGRNCQVDPYVHFTRLWI